MAALFCMQEGGETVGRPKKFKSPKDLADAWENYKEYCDNRMVLVHDFSSKNSEFVSAELRKSVTYTIEGFCAKVGISRSAFYQTYEQDKRYSDIVTRMREECEVDAREKFELQVIPSQLAGLWMSKYGYTTKQENSIDERLSLEQSRLYDLIGQMRGGGDSS
ncbi:DNA-packaging protein [Oribacterium sp. oral taxon 102]|uniref:DNA-packaging protein n=1 Tax=Oribacterium sp. oral taxon 102 TaxID=671214 RepID=UPI001FAD8552|nr:DNA-packaging protein [Oribacterium sp. oral taxon 102]